MTKVGRHADVNVTKVAGAAKRLSLRLGELHAFLDVLE